jgi:uncharacterized protein (DUF362 family)
LHLKVTPNYPNPLISFPIDKIKELTQSILFRFHEVKVISVIKNDHSVYPDGEDFFSPHVRYPEYSFEHLATSQNCVYEMVRNVFAQAGLDHSHYGTADWNPLGEFIRPGSSVFVLCNFVFQRRPNESETNFSAKCTHGSVLRSAIDYILRAIGPSGRVAFGNAPIQSCSWTSVLRDTGADRVAQFYSERHLPVETNDLRTLLVERKWLGILGQVTNSDEKDIIEIDFSHQSLLRKLDKPSVFYRSLDYDARQTEAFQQSGRHLYGINRKILETDVIFSIPKLKTHAKVGMTCAIKGSVGAVANKNCLPHHRIGSPVAGGDQFDSDPLGIISAVSNLNEIIQRTPVEKSYGRGLRFLNYLLQACLRRLGYTMEGNWWGNDTCWRMAVDLARILAYATPDGKLQKVPVRRHLALVDGIVGGEGQGPLSPVSVNSGTIIFGDNVVTTDYAAAIMMGYDPSALPIVWNATKIDAYSLLTRLPRDEKIFYNGAQTSFERLVREVLYHYTPHRGWKDHL